MVEFDEFLQHQRGEGRYDSEGRFTLATDQALAKMAGFQLPESELWAAKVIQALVAGGAKAIEVKVGRHQTDIRAPKVGWDRDRFLEEFAHPEPSRDRGLNHLKQGLWSVGLGERRPFAVACGGWSNTVFWSGQALVDMDRKAGPGFHLAVTHLEAGQDSGWWESRRQIRELNLKLVSKLRKTCYVCPVSLTVDGCRIDSLFLAPELGCPLALVWANGEIPEMGLPPGTGRILGEPRYLETEFGLGSVYRNWLRSHRSAPRTSMAILLRSYVFQSGAYRRPKARRSETLWVCDGAVVAREPLFEIETLAHASLYLNAEGLPTDLTGLVPRSGPERAQRLEQAYALAAEAVSEVSLEFPKDSNLHRKFVGLMLGVPGALVTLVKFPIGAPMLALGWAIGTGRVLDDTKDQPSSWADRYGESIERLPELFQLARRRLDEGPE